MVMQLSRLLHLIGLTLFFIAGCTFVNSDVASISEQKKTRRAAGMIRTSREVLAPVYGPLAEQIVADFKLVNKTGTGIDVGSGPGTLIIELCKRTKLHWINADINPHFFAYFYRQAEKNGFGHRVSAVFSDVHSLVFRCNYADIIVSRGSFHLWADKVKAFEEIYRVLKPGASAYIGRGFSENLPVETAKKVRAKQRLKKYDVQETANELREVMNKLGIKQYRIHCPKPAGSEGVNYGVWLEFRKPKGQSQLSGKSCKSQL